MATHTNLKIIRLDGTVDVLEMAEGVDFQATVRSFAANQGVWIKSVFVPWHQVRAVEKVDV